MHKWIFALLVALNAASTLALTVDTRIDKVSVYLYGGATVERTGSVTLPGPGEHQLELIGLSADMDVSSMRVALSGPGMQLGQVRSDVAHRVAAIDAEAQAMRERIEALRETISALDDRIATAEMKLRFLDGIAQGYAKESWFEGARGQADINSWREALSVLDEGASDARRTIRDTRFSRQTEQRELERLEDELDELGGQSGISGTVMVTVRAAQAGRAELRLSYVQERVRWYPGYDVRLQSASRQLDILKQANVQQETDEPWENVRLVLSDGKPSETQQATELESTVLDLRKPRPRSMPAPQTFSRSVGVADASSNGQQIEEIIVTGSRVPPTVLAYGVQYELPGRVTIDNDEDDTQTFDLERISTTVELLSRVVPNESTQAFLEGKFVYAGETPLRGGEYAIHVDGMYQGTAELSWILPGAEARVALGQDNRLTVRAIDQAGSKGDRGLFGRRQQYTSDDLFEVTNRHTEAVTVEVWDQLPVAGHDDIEVDVPRAATQPTETDVDDEPGIVIWRKTVAAGETWRVRHVYEVSWPDGMELHHR